MIVLAGAALLAGGAIIGAMLFGVDWPIALLIILGVALITLWLLGRSSRR